MEGPTTSSYRLFVGGLGPEATEEELSGRFKSFGKTSNVSIARGDRMLIAAGKPKLAAKTCRGFGFVTIECTEEQLNKLLKTFENTKWKGRDFRVEVSNTPSLVGPAMVEYRQAEAGAFEEDLLEQKRNKPTSIRNMTNFESEHLRMKLPYMFNKVNIPVGKNKHELTEEQQRKNKKEIKASKLEWIWSLSNIPDDPNADPRLRGILGESEQEKETHTDGATESTSSETDSSSSSDSDSDGSSHGACGSPVLRPHNSTVLDYVSSRNALAKDPAVRPLLCKINRELQARRVLVHGGQYQAEEEAEDLKKLKMKFEGDVFDLQALLAKEEAGKKLIRQEAKILKEYRKIVRARENELWRVMLRMKLDKFTDDSKARRIAMAKKKQASDEYDFPDAEVPLEFEGDPFTTIDSHSVFSAENVRTMQAEAARKEEERRLRAQETLKAAQEKDRLVREAAAREEAERLAKEADIERRRLENAERKARAKKLDVEAEVRGDDSDSDGDAVCRGADVDLEDLYGEDEDEDADDAEADEAVDAYDFPATGEDIGAEAEEVMADDADAYDFPAAEDEELVADADADVVGKADEGMDAAAEFKMTDDEAVEAVPVPVVAKTATKPAKAAPVKAAKAPKVAAAAAQEQPASTGVSAASPESKADAPEQKDMSKKKPARDADRKRTRGDDSSDDDGGSFVPRTLNRPVRTVQLDEKGMRIGADAGVVSGELRKIDLSAFDDDDDEVGDLTRVITADNVRVVERELERTQAESAAKKGKKKAKTKPVKGTSLVTALLPALTKAEQAPAAPGEVVEAVEGRIQGQFKSKGARYYAAELDSGAVKVTVKKAPESDANLSRFDDDSDEEGPVIAFGRHTADPADFEIVESNTKIEGIHDDDGIVLKNDWSDLDENDPKARRRRVENAKRVAMTDVKVMDKYSAADEYVGVSKAIMKSIEENENVEAEMDMPKIKSLSEVGFASPSFRGRGRGGAGGARGGFGSARGFSGPSRGRGGASGSRGGASGGRGGSSGGRGGVSGSRGGSAGGRGAFSGSRGGSRGGSAGGRGGAGRGGRGRGGSGRGRGGA